MALAPTLYPLSHPQQREIITEKMYPETPFANCPFTVKMNGTVDFPKLEQAINLTLLSHDGLRTRLTEDDLEVKQYIFPYAPYPCEYVDFSSEFGQARYQRWLDQRRNKPFTLYDSDLFSFVLVSYPDGRQGLFLNIHHVICDAWTVKVVLKSIAGFYGDLVSGAIPTGGDFRPDPKPCHLDYLDYEAQYLNSERCADDRRYWMDQFAEPPEPLVLPYNQSKDFNIAIEKRQVEISTDLGARILEFSRKHHISFYQLATAAFYIYLARITRQEELTLGMMTANRPLPEMSEMVGMFVNVLPLKLTVPGDQPALEFLKGLHGEIKEATRSRGEYPFDMLVNDLKKKNPDTPNLVNVVLIGQGDYDIYGDDSDAATGAEPVVTSRFVPSDWEQPPFYLTVNIFYNMKRPDRFQLLFVFPRGLYKSDDINRMISHLELLMSDMIDHPSKTIDQLDMVPQSELDILLNAFNQTAADFPLEKTVVDLYAERVAAHPDHPAVVFQGRQWSFAELDRRAEILAERIRRLGVGPEQFVGILVEPSLEMILGPLAVLKAGAAYVPIDHSYPSDRVAYMLSDSEAKVVLIRNSHKEAMSDFDGTVIIIDDEALFEGTTPAGQNKAAGPKPHDAAYIIYTSGSTGKPKGVLIEHRSLTNHAFEAITRLEITPEDKMTKYAGFSFDASVCEIYPALIGGATLHILDTDTKKSVRDLNEYFETEGITKSFLPTQFLEHFMEMADNRSLKIVYSGGDKLKRFKPQPYRVLNIYGPTEATVYVTFFHVDAEYENIPIGAPVANTRIYILDRNLRPVPIGVPGELCISGVCLAREYLHLPDKTAAAFVDHPFVPGERMYRTGDLARFRPDGRIEFLGRIDFQVKIRGFRIELGEIEKVLLAYHGVHEAIAVARDDEAGNKYLSAYLVSASLIDIDELKTFLLQSLPDYMVPPYIIQLEHMPINASGKIDRKKLPLPSIKRTITPPENGVEEKLVEFWCKVLKLEQVGTTENFFDLGGHSLLVTALQAGIEDFFNIQISFSDIFSRPTITQQAGFIKSARKVNLATIEPVPGRDYYPVSAAQRRIIFWENTGTSGITYNLPLLFEFKGKLDYKALNRAVDTIIARHDSLRTSFDIVNDQPVQIVHPEVTYKKKIIEITTDRLEEWIENFVYPFDLKKPPLFRLVLLKFSDTHHTLLWDIHHAVFDGSSLVVLVEELRQLYLGEALPPLRIQYKDFTDWQNQLFMSDMIKPQEEYWLNQFKDDIPVLNMPTDFPRPAQLDHKGENIFSTVDTDVADRLRDFAKSQKMTLYPLFVALYNLLIAKYSGNEDIVVGAGMAGRSQIDVQKLIGMFVNTIALRNFPSGDRTFIDFLNEVQQNFLNAYSYQDYQFDHLVNKLHLVRDPSRTPLFDMGIVYQSMGFPAIAIGDLTLTASQYVHKAAHADILLEIVDQGDSFSFRWEYRTSLFKQETIHRFAGHFNNLISAVLSDPGRKLSDYEIISPAEKEELLYTFNRTEAKWPREQCVHYIIEENAARFPDRIAITFKDRQITYRELNERANQMAHSLRNAGVGPDDFIGIMLDNSVEMIVAIFAILKAGGCYVPMKPDFPADRIGYILDNCKAKMLVSTAQYRDRATGFSGQFIDVDDPAAYSANTANPDHINTPDNLIYVIYTSGSTGKPKGVMLEHRNIVRLFINSTMPYDLGKEDAWSMFHAFSFDFSVWEIFGALLYGARLVVVPKSVIINPENFLALLKKEKVTILSQTPGAFYNLIETDLLTDDHDLAIRYVTFGGEALKPGLLMKWHREYPETKLINMYGITETTVHVTFKEITEEDMAANISNIGKPIPTLTTYLMDANLKLVPIGVPGEICVSGDGLARGYLGLPEKTADRFIKHPYIDNMRMYRSGDLAKIHPGGDMEYMGRIDFQVKIRGFRIELGEIENRLLAHPLIAQTAVLARDDGKGDKILVAYVVAENDRQKDADGGLSVRELKGHLGKDLPEYMIPSYFVELDSLPLNVNGKVDRNKLPEPTDHLDTGVQFVPPKNDRQTRIARAWARVLGIEAVSIADDFFDIGGHSLKAVSLVAELQKNFEVTVNDIFKYRTIEELSRHITEHTGNISARFDNISQIVEMEKQRTAAFMESDAARGALKRYRERNSAYEKVDLSRKNKYKRILLTGATGYLGIYILNTLLTNHPEVEVYTIVRGDSAAHCLERLKKQCLFYLGETFYSQYEKRIHVLCGDLGKPELGLGAKTNQMLTQKMDAIIHVAALVKHYGDFDIFHQCNVLATDHLISLAMTGPPKDFHHISTLSIATGDVADLKNFIFTEYDYDFGQHSDNHYVSTKFEAEGHLIAAREKGLNCNIYRVGNISIHSRTGHLQQDIENNAFYTVVKGYVNVGAVPINEDEAEFAFVDHLADAVVRLAYCADLKNENFHLRNAQFVKLSKLLGHESLNLRLDQKPFPDFIKHLEEHYDVLDFKRHIEKYLLHAGYLPMLSTDPEDYLAQATTVDIRSEKTEKILAGLGFVWPELKPEQLHRFILKTLSERIDFFKKAPLFDGVDDDVINEIAPLAVQKWYPNESFLVWEGRDNDRFHLIADGAVELYKSARQGWQGTLSILGPGQFLGEDAIFGTNPSQVVGEAIFDGVRAFSFNGADVNQFILDHPVLGLRLMKALHQRIQNLESMIISLE